MTPRTCGYISCDKEGTRPAPWNALYVVCDEHAKETSGKAPMTTQPTPGPWIVETHDTKYPDLKEYSVIAPRGWQEPNGEYKACSVAHSLDCEADARLIAAAPRMLEALKSVTRWAERLEQAYRDKTPLPAGAWLNDYTAEARALLRDLHGEGQK